MDDLYIELSGKRWNEILEQTLDTVIICPLLADKKYHRRKSTHPGHFEKLRGEDIELQAIIPVSPWSTSRVMFRAAIRLRWSSILNQASNRSSHALAASG
jgi:hypothetical protein